MPGTDGRPGPVPLGRVGVVGGGPGGLYVAALLKRLEPAREVTVYERNPAGHTFGYGIVLSDETLSGVAAADPELHAALQDASVRWDDIAVTHRGRTLRSTGHRFAALERRRLLGLLQERCEQLGVLLRFETPAPDVGELAAEYDLVVAADGAGSRVRGALGAHLGPQLTEHRCRYLWLTAELALDAFHFEIAEAPSGIVQLHAYPYRDAGPGRPAAATVLVEARAEVWQAEGFDALNSRERAARCAALFPHTLRGALPQGREAHGTSFRTLVNDRWSHGNTVLLGDAAHTAHFSIGSGTKLALEDALALAACLTEHAELPAALAAYEEERRTVVASTQRAARASLEWFEELHRYVQQPPHRFAFNLLTRSRRVTHENLRLRDAEFTAAVEREAGVPAETPPMFTPYRLGELPLRNRVVVSPMDTYRAAEGVPGDFHLAHLVTRALGGAGLVLTEMVCVSSQGRITPGCAGLWTDEQEAAWRRIVAAVHTESPTAAIGVQLGHSGRKGATKLMWEGIDEPLPHGSWPLVAPSPLPYLPDVGQTPRALDAAGLAAVREEFTQATERAARAGFDTLELHCGHGYLLSSFLSPLTNRRTDGYGGDLAGRLRYPLEVFDAVRAAWPAERPMTVRISATDWAPGGTTAEDALHLAAAFAAHGADAVNVSTGQVVPYERPDFGRSYQTPYADWIRNSVGVPVITAGAVSSWDDVNSLLLAGRADLCALARPHLWDPHWTLHAAADQGYSGPGAPWPEPYRAGSRRPPAGRESEPKPRLTLGEAGADARTA